MFKILPIMGRPWARIQGNLVKIKILRYEILSYWGERGGLAQGGAFERDTESVSARGRMVKA